jgi:hypothetical protein
MIYSFTTYQIDCFGLQPTAKIFWDYRQIVVLAHLHEIRTIGAKQIGHFFPRFFLATSFLAFLAATSMLWAAFITVASFAFSASVIFLSRQSWQVPDRAIIFSGLHLGRFIL